MEEVLETILYPLPVFNAHVQPVTVGNEAILDGERVTYEGLHNAIGLAIAGVVSDEDITTVSVCVQPELSLLTI